MERDVDARVALLTPVDLTAFVGQLQICHFVVNHHPSVVVAVVPCLPCAWLSYFRLQSRSSPTLLLY